MRSATHSSSSKSLKIRTDTTYSDQIERLAFLS